MSLLEKLVEVKDLNIFFSLRINRLKEEKKLIKNYPKEKRELVVHRIEGRIAELERLRGLIASKKLKADCKKMWKHFDYVKRKKIKEK